MNSSFKRLLVAGVACSAMFLSLGSGAVVFTGTLYYTNFTGPPSNVNSVAYTYDDSGAGLFTLGAPVSLASPPGADGIVFRPNGNLLIGGAGSSAVFEIVPGTGATVATYPTGSTASFHLTLDPGGSKVWTSTFGGPLVEVPFVGAPTTHTVSGADGGLTQIAFAPNGSVFYVNGAPNGGGNVGLIDLTTFVTTRLFTGITSAHGLVYDPFADRMTLFGAGAVGSFSIGGTGLLERAIPGVCDFDQGTVDGAGLALIAGCGSITLVDYRATGEITHALNRSFVIGGFSGIDDVAPLVGVGAPPPPGIPEPGTLALLCLGLFGLASFTRSRVARRD